MIVQGSAFPLIQQSLLPLTIHFLFIFEFSQELSGHPCRSSAPVVWTLRIRLNDSLSLKVVTLKIKQLSYTHLFSRARTHVTLLSNSKDLKVCSANFGSTLCYSPSSQISAFTISWSLQQKLSHAHTFLLVLWVPRLASQSPVSGGCLSVDWIHSVLKLQFVQLISFSPKKIYFNVN